MLRECADQALLQAQAARLIQDLKVVANPVS